MNDLFIQGLTIDWNRVRPYNYVRQIPAISGIDTFTFHKPITFFVGENGSGKSTLLEAIAVAYGFNAEVVLMMFGLTMIACALCVWCIMTYGVQGGQRGTPKSNSYIIHCL